MTVTATGEVATLSPEMVQIQGLAWGSDGEEVWFSGADTGVSRRLFAADLVDVATGERRPWRELRPPDPAGVVVTVPVLVTPDGTSYAYCYLRESS
jgi:hypothetical protein